jgi:hypothetical protein
LERDLDSVDRDLRGEYISRRAAETLYGVCVDEKTGGIDRAASVSRRRDLKAHDSEPR